MASLVRTTITCASSCHEFAVLSLRAPPPERLDLSGLVPHRLLGKSAAQLAGIELNTGRHPITVGEVFRVRMGAPAAIRIEGGSERLDRVGAQMIDGEIVVEGNVGAEAGRLMAGGQLRVTGNSGPYTASGMKGGRLEIGGHAGDRLGGPLAGETAGMRGGIVVVRGNVGARAADRMRRGIIIVEGRSGPYPGSRMIAGTLIVRGPAGVLPGYLMRRGTIVLGTGSDEPAPTFADCGSYSLVAMRLLAAFVADHSQRAATALRKPLRRFSGDLATLGKGELLVVEQDRRG